MWNILMCMPYIQSDHDIEDFVSLANMFYFLWLSSTWPIDIILACFVFTNLYIYKKVDSFFFLKYKMDKSCDVHRCGVNTLLLEFLS